MARAVWMEAPSRHAVTGTVLAIRPVFGEKSRYAGGRHDTGKPCPDCFTAWPVVFSGARAAKTGANAPADEATQNPFSAFVQIHD